MAEFVLSDTITPTEVQEEAAELLAQSVQDGNAVQTLLGVTGSGKTATMAVTMAKLQRPALVIAHNKTLAAQLYHEFKELFPDNAVEYFVSYYDFYRPEAYVPSSDTYVEKEAMVNEEIERLRHSTTAALLSRRDVIVVASVSCIYGLGNPDTYRQQVLAIGRGVEIDREAILRQLVALRYERNDTLLEPGTFKVRGEVIEIQPPHWDDQAYRVTLFGDEVEQIAVFEPLTGKVVAQVAHAALYPATHYNVDQTSIEHAVTTIMTELDQVEAGFQAEDKLIEAQRIRQRTTYDMEMLQEMGYCNGIENYSPVLEGRDRGARPACLLDYFPEDFVCFVDESHQTLPQIHGMYRGDQARKQTLIDWGFRLPSALDNRPQTWDEFIARVGPLVTVSATPGEWERQQSDTIAELIVRPTGLVDPPVEVRPTLDQIDDLINEIQTTITAGYRTLVTTLTKKMAEDLSDYLTEMGVATRYLHSDIKTIERVEVIRELRLGNYDVLVGVNLLREGLDIPEVGLVAILDADKEGFLRGETSLVQTIGRAARNRDGRVLMYADRHSRAMELALSETNRRREIQEAYNRKHGITPRSISKGVSPLSESFMLQARAAEERNQRKRVGKRATKRELGLSVDEAAAKLIALEEDMFAASEQLRFEEAAELRDQIKEIQLAYGAALFAAEA
jgi:excinuclease ABC subunit B